MPIDPSIPLGFQMPKLTSPMEVAGQAMSLKALLQQTQLRNQQIQQGMQTLKVQSTLSQLAADEKYFKGGSWTREGVEEIAKLSPDIAVKINKERVDTDLKQKEIEYKTSYIGKLNDERLSKAIHEVVEEAVGVYDDTLKRTGSKAAATDAYNHALSDGYNDLKKTGRGGVTPDFQFRMMSYDDASRKLLSIKERKELENQTKTPLIKEVEYANDLRSRIIGMSPNDPALPGLKRELAQIEAGIAKRDVLPKYAMNLGAGANGPAVSPSQQKLTGEEFLKTLQPIEANKIRALAEGRLTFSDLGIRGKDREAAVAKVTQYDPDFDAATAKARYTAVKDFSTGKNGNTVRSLNVSIDHLDTLQKAGEALKNGNMQDFNKIGNLIAEKTGEAAPTDFEATKKIVADEIVKGIVGYGGAASDREEAAKAISSVKSPAQLTGVINRYKDLLGGQLNGLKKQYEATTQRKDFDERFLTPEAREQLGGRNKPAPKTMHAPAAALEYLKAHPETKDQFKAKFGYLPEGV